MQVRDVMQARVVSVNVDTPIDEVMAVMRMNQVTFLPVTHERVCAGVITESDINSQMQDASFDPTATTAGMVLSEGKDRDEITATGVHAVSEDASLEEALRQMTDLGVQHLAVHNDEFVMIGVVSRKDLEQPLMAQLT